MFRGIRGAITVDENEPADILAATLQLTTAMMAQNQLHMEDIASIIFSVTPDLDAVFPAQALRGKGFDYVPLLDCCEVPVPGSLEKCIRILMHVNTDKGQRDIVHVYLGGARVLRKDLVKP